MANFTASFLQHVNKKIFDETGNSIFSIQYSEDVLPYKFERPLIKFNTLNKTREEKEPILKRISTVPELAAKGWQIVSIPITKEMAWRRRQINMLVLKRKGTLLNPGEKSLTFFPNKKGDDYHKIIVDEANLRIKLLGPRAGNTGEGPWIDMVV